MNQKRQQQRTEVVKESIMIMREMRLHLEWKSHKNCCCKKIVAALGADHPTRAVSFFSKNTSQLSRVDLNRYE